MRLVVRGVLCALLLPALAGATGTFDGLWGGRGPSEGNDAPVFQLDLKSNGAQLTGTVTQGPVRFSIENGTASEDGVIFDAVKAVDGGASQLALSCRGTLKDGGIELTCQVAGGGEKTFVLQRMKGA